jgi:hypothetical protein
MAFNSGLKGLTTTTTDVNHQSNRGDFRELFTLQRQSPLSRFSRTRGRNPKYLSPGRYIKIVLSVCGVFFVVYRLRRATVSSPSARGFVLVAHPSDTAPHQLPYLLGDH